MQIKDWASCPTQSKLYRELAQLGLLENIAELDVFGYTVVPPEKVGPPEFHAKVKAAVVDVVERRFGRIINIAGVTPYIGGPPAKSMVKLGIVGLTRGLAREFAPYNILVNTVCIGKIKSGHHERRYTKAGISADEYYAKDSKTIPLGRFGEAAEAANVIVFLCSAAASYVTGTSVNLDGGMSGVL